MKTLSALAACALLALAAPALAQNNSGSSAQDPLQKNGSPNGADASHAKQPGASDAGAGKHDPVNEGRSSASDPNAGANGETRNTGQQ